MTRMKVVLAAALAGLLAASALAATGDPKRAHSLAGMLRAKEALLRRSDFPAGWKSTPAAPAAGANACKDSRPSFADLTETGSAVAPAFSLGSLQQVTQRVRVFANVGQARSAFLRTDTIGLVACLAEQLKGASSAKATTSIVGQFRLSPPKVAQQIDGFRVVAHTSVPSEHEQFDVYADVVVIRQGATLTTVTMTGFVKPIDAGTEARLTRTIAGRLGGKTTVA